MSCSQTIFKGRHLLGGVGSIALVFCVYALAQAQNAPTGVGPFTQAQVDAGRTAYAEQCADCHGDTLGGGPNGPGLTGPSFMGRWGSQTTADYYKFMSSTMPYGNEGNLSEATYSAIAAFIYAANGARPGTQTYTAATSAPFAGMVNGQPVASVINAPQTEAGEAGPSAGRGAPIAAAGRGGAAAPTSVFGQTVHGTVPNYTDVTDDMLRNPPPGDWLMFRRIYQGHSYSPLTQITPANIKNLQLKWTWNMNEGGANQPTPLVHNGVMFLANSQNVIQALDARNGNLIWEHRLGPDTRAYYGNRSLGLWKDKVYTATSDAHLVALDARTGRQVWKVQIAPPPRGETGGVIVIKGKVLVGLMGCDTYRTEQCYISAYDAETGARDWKFYTAALNGTPGGDTWNGLEDIYKGGVDTWIAGTYDPVLNTTYWGTAQAKPWFRASRRTFDGHALYSSSTLALNPDNGSLKWYFQHIPGETLDLDEVFERVLIDHGQSKEVFTIGKSGILWKLNRETGKFISLLPMIFQNVYSKIDYKTGELTYRDDILNQKTNEWFGSCPGPEGGHNWQATSYNQPTDLLIVPLSQSCVMITGRDVELKLGSGGTANSQTFFFQPGSNRQMGRLSAVNTSTMKVAWTWEQRAPFLTAVLSTRAGVAFVGDFDRVFRAVDVKTGKELWRTRLGNTAQGYPISFAIDGKQYIAVTTGLGGGSPQQKPTLLLQNYVKRPPTGHQIYVFGLPD